MPIQLTHTGSLKMSVDIYWYIPTSVLVVQGSAALFSVDAHLPTSIVLLLMAYMYYFRSPT